jgi:prepilin-type N-terminal cleavage/methylation domain-containing protein
MRISLRGTSFRHPFRDSSWFRDSSLRTPSLRSDESRDENPRNDESRNDESRNDQSGFSLLEVLIALALTVMLISAVYAAIGLYWRFEQAGRVEMERRQIIRAIVARMDEDLGSIVFQPPSDESFDDLFDEELEEPTPLTLGGLEEEGTGLTFGLVGNAERLHLSVSKPSRSLSYASFLEREDPESRMSDLMTATYGLAPVPTGQERMTTTRFVPTAPPVDPAIEAQRPKTGFGRRLYDLYALTSASESLEPHDVIAPEITDVRFRYFDGADWVGGWDSREMGALPRAVEVIFTFWNEPVRPRGQAGGRFVPQGTYTDVRHVFYIPLSEPMVDLLY